MADDKLITIVVPVFNEEKNISPLIKRLETALGGIIGYEFEVLFVDDGSRDSTVAQVIAQRSSLLKIGYIKLSRNFGHQYALEAGLKHAKGEAIITMDGDLQHPPEMIPQMLREFANGAEVVQMVRENIKGYRVLMAYTFYAFFKRISKYPLVPNAADFRLISRTIAEEIKKTGKGKLLRAIIPALGYKQVFLQYTQEDRLHGSPSYGFFDLLALAVRTLLKFTTFPAVFGLVSSFIFLLASLVGFITLAVLGILSTTNYLLMVLTLFLAGLIMGTFGILSWFLYFILEQTRPDPSFIIMEMVEPTKKEP